MSFLIPSIRVYTAAKEIDLFAQACRRQRIKGKRGRHQLTILRLQKER